MKRHRSTFVIPANAKLERPMPALTPKMKRLAAALLDLAAESFSHRSCNEFKLPKDFTDEDVVMLERAIHINDGDPDEARTNPKQARQQDDWILMHFLAKVLRQDAGPPETPS